MQENPVCLHMLLPKHPEFPKTMKNSDNKCHQQKESWENVKQVLEKTEVIFWYSVGGLWLIFQ